MIRSSSTPFSEFDNALPHRRIDGSLNPFRFADHSRPLDGTYQHQGSTHSFDHYLARHHVTALLVVHDGAVVHDCYRPGLGRGTRWHLFSAAKSFVGTLVGRALNDGVIDSLDDPITKYVSIDGAYGLTTIRHLMTMSSGVDFFLFQGSPNQAEWIRQIWHEERDPDEFAAELGPRVAPGTDFNYQGNDSHILSMVVRAAYGQPLHQIVHEQLWGPIGIAGDASWSQHLDGDAGHAFGHACLSVRAIDLAHLGQLMVNDGVWDGRRLLPEGFVTMSSTPPTSGHDPFDDGPGYGYQWRLPHDYDGEMAAMGALGQMLYVDREPGVVIAQIAAAPLPKSTDDPPDGKERWAALRGIVHSVSA